MLADALIARLDKVRRVGDGRWMACCPAHGEKTPSLSITERDDKVLIHCHGQHCGASEILEAVGLDASALFPPRPADHRGKGRRRDHSAADALRTLAWEAKVVRATASFLGTGEPLSQAALDRLIECISRIDAALGACGITISPTK